MFRDYNKYLSTSVKVYLFVLVIIFILKLVGLDYFGLSADNPVIVKVNDFALKFNLTNVWFFITLYIYTYFIVSISCDNKDLKLKSLIFTIIGVFVKIFERKYCKTLSVLLIDVGYISIVCAIVNKKYNLKQILLRSLGFIFLTVLYQAISMIVRVNSLNNYNYNFIQFILLDLDYMLLCIITHKIYFEKRGEKVCTMEVGSYSQKKMNLKKLLKKLHQNWLNFKQLNKEDKLSLIIYLILSLIWNILSVAIVLLVANLNQTLIEYIFILTSFWLSKRAFGKAFHLSSMLHCFIVSNVSYYILNRITTPLGISIFVPILLGVGLSYITSKLVKKTYKPLYRGMPEDLFEETILKVTDKDSDKYKICYEFYMGKESDVSLSFKYNYSVIGIRKIRERINDSIKRL